MQIFTSFKLEYCVILFGFIATLDYSNLNPNYKANIKSLHLIFLCHLNLAIVCIFLVVLQLWTIPI